MMTDYRIATRALQSIRDDILTKLARSKSSDVAVILSQAGIEIGNVQLALSESRLALHAAEKVQV